MVNMNIPEPDETPTKCNDCPYWEQCPEGCDWGWCRENLDWTHKEDEC